MADSAAARDALYAHIVEGLEEAKEALSAGARASAIKELALAFRLTTGGAQPGSSVLKD